jgi:hypothetical protein
MQTQEIDDYEELTKGLPLFDDKWEPSPEDIKKAVGDTLKRIEDEENSTMLFDPVEKDYRTYAHCKKKYGQDFADKMLRAKKENNGRIDKEDYAKLMSHHQRMEKQVAPALKPAKARAPFVMLDHETIKNPKVRKILKKSMMLYLYLRTYIVREKFAGDLLNLYEGYFKKGKLAASVSIRKLAHDLEINPKTVTAYLQEMSEHKVIEIEKIHSADSYDNQVHNVYVLGRHDFSKMESYLVEELATSDG